ncbi:MAG: PrgI family protein [Candidatus Nealsonbacteria bacterium]|nr:PrgI family protein [Candidatus Nealsonbacteria bacterium]
MDQFTVPQFIEEKAKVIGPMTFQQFIYVGTAGAICFVLYFTIHFFFFIMASLVIFSFAAILAFGKSNGRPLPVVIKNIFIYRMRPKIYLWKKKVGPPLKLIQAKKPEAAGIRESPVPTAVGKSKLKDLSDQVGH